MNGSGAMALTIFGEIGVAYGAREFILKIYEGVHLVETVEEFAKCAGH